MPAKTGGSHALAAFMSTILGTVLSKYVWSYAPPLAEAGAAVGDMLGVIGVTFSDEQAGGLIVILGLSFVWGVVYHLARDGGDDGDRREDAERRW